MNNQKTYDLENRTFLFAKSVRDFFRKLPKKLENIDDLKQLIRSSGSIGANYIEANEKLGDTDFLYRIRISKKEAKETIYWLNLLEIDNNYEQERKILVKEAQELIYILAKILKNRADKT